MGNFWVRENAIIEKSETSKLRKRTIDEVDNDQDIIKAKLEEENLHTPKRKKLKSTSKYIYDTLFVNGENSDVIISALGREWKLHKVYLCQSGYFCSMFSGSWKESSKDIIHMNIPDDNIDEEALEIAFGSLYRDDVLITPALVVSVLAAATLLGLDGLIQQCADIMMENISVKTVCVYHAAAVMYGQQKVSQHCLGWLEKNIMTTQCCDLLKDIGISVMRKIIESEDLFVMQVEMDVYSMLKKWLFLQLNQTWTGGTKALAHDSDNFFKKQASESKCAFLETESGKQYQPVFADVRLQHVISDLTSVKLLEQDKVIPQGWLLPLYKQQWFQMLRVEQGIDKGLDSADYPSFGKEAMRCGRVLQREGEYCWRWTGFNFGLDLLMSVTKRLVTLKRNAYSQSSSGSVSLQAKRNIVFRVTVASLNSLGQTVFIKHSEILKVALSKDEEAVIMSIDPQVPFPLYVSVNWLVYHPQEVPGSAGQSSSQHGNSSSNPAEQH